jgi:NAD(P)-dependent dehydrogenase (short-subunit alcohol dehydrogenase family)
VGDVDIVVNNAGYFPNRSLDELDLPTWRKTMATNLDAQFSWREIFPTSDEKEQVGPLCRLIVKHGRPGYAHYLLVKRAYRTEMVAGPDLLVSPTFEHQRFCRPRGFLP